MKIKSASVSNFRVPGEVRLELGNMTALIGSNGSGKTALLLAIARFFSRERKMSPANFGRKGFPITVTVVAEGEGGETMEVTRKWRPDKKSGRAVSEGYFDREGAAARPDGFLAARVVYVPAGHELTGSVRSGRDTVLQSLVNNIAGNGAAGAGRGRPLGGARASLERVEEVMNKKLGARDGVGYAPNIGVRLGFGDPVGRAGLRMDIIDREAGVELDYAHVGHGARRALHMAALEADADILAEGGAQEAGAGMATLYVIDEPELHQHPQRQDLIFGALRRLSEEPSSQVLYSTHSPHFVELGAQMEIRKIRRTSAGIGMSVASAGDGTVRGGVMRPIVDAIFANGAVLVEGHHDEVILKTVLRATPHNGKSLMDALAGGEISVVDCQSKYNIGHYYKILNPLGIKCFVVWDGDMGMEGDLALGQAKRENRKLLDMLGESLDRAEEIEGSAHDGCVVGDTWVCFGHDAPAYFARCFDLSPKVLEKKIKDGEEIGRLLDVEWLAQGKFCKKALSSLRRALVE